MDGEADAERLVVLIEARVNDMEKAMRRAAGTAEHSYGRMRRGSRTATDQMEADMLRSTSRINQALAQASTRIGAYGKAFAVGMVGGMTAGGIEAIAQRVQGLVREVATLGDEAARAGLSLRSFQEWKVVADTIRVPVDAVVDAFKELNIRADEFVATGAGSASEAFARLGMSPEDVKTRLKDPSALMVELIERTQRLKNTAAGTRIFDELFGGTGGERLVKMLQMADGEIGSIIRSAHDAGRIFDIEMVRKADEMDRRWSAAWATFDTNAKAAIFNVVSYLDSVAAKMNDIGNADFFKWLVGKLDAAGMIDPSLQRAGENADVAAGRANLVSLERQTKMLEQAIANQRNLGFDAAEATRELAKARADMETEIARILSDGGRGTIGETAAATPIIQLQEVQEIDRAADFMKRYRDELKLTSDQRRLASETERIMADAMKTGVHLTRVQAHELADLTLARDRAEKAAAVTTRSVYTSDQRMAKAYQDLVDRTQEFIGAQRLEAQVIGMSEQAAGALRYNLDMLADARREGISLSAEQKNAVHELAAAFEQEIDQ